MGEGAHDRVTDAGMVDYLLDQLDDPAISARRMFGGHGIYRDGRMFAIVYDDAVYLKVSDDEAKTSDRPPFRPRPNQTFPTYREVSADELEDADTLREMAVRARASAS
ncbi:MAG TPA: TfoX/Sxy family protein [Actinomycetota bacterium]|nr:TfoX/Sxy family protein [Actinomycetota bacterium]